MQYESIKYEILLEFSFLFYFYLIHRVALVVWSTRWHNPNTNLDFHRIKIRRSRDKSVWCAILRWVTLWWGDFYWQMTERQIKNKKLSSKEASSRYLAKIWTFFLWKKQRKTITRIMNRKNTHLLIRWNVYKCLWFLTNIYTIFHYFLLKNWLKPRTLTQLPYLMPHFVGI